MIRSAVAAVVFVALSALAACSTKAATSPAEGAPAGPPDAGASPVPLPSSTAPTPDAGAATDPSAAASPATSASAPPAPEAPLAPDAPLPKVAVANIGMHIGGGPNDDVTKDPIRKSVAPHFDELKRCFARADDQAKAGDFGVDVRIERAGGTAQVSHPRTTIKGKDFRECVVHVFETIDFRKPKGGKTTVSYSLRFTPGKEAP